MKIITACCLILSGFFLCLAKGLCSEVMSSADVYSADEWSFSVYGAETTKDVSMRRENGLVSSEPGTEIGFKSENELRAMKLAYRPNDGLMYFFRIGTLDNFSLEYSSGSRSNRFKGDSGGSLWGVGARWNLTQDTPVSAAFSLELSYSALRMSVDSYEAGQTLAVNDKFLQDEVQGAFNVSKRLGFAQPYGGVKLMFVKSVLKDQSTKEKMVGRDWLISPFLGMQWELFPKEYLVIEGSFLDEEMLSGGFRINF